VHWEPNAFAPVTVEKLAEFDGTGLSPARPGAKVLFDTGAILWFHADSPNHRTIRYLHVPSQRQASSPGSAQFPPV
jgi:hypothetical protein